MPRPRYSGPHVQLVDDPVLAAGVDREALGQEEDAQGDAAAVVLGEDGDHGGRPAAGVGVPIEAASDVGVELLAVDPGQFLPLLDDLDQRLFDQLEDCVEFVALRDVDIHGVIVASGPRPRARLTAF